MKLLRECLNHNPSSKPVHLDLAKLLASKGETADRTVVLEHLKRSFTEGDANFDAQFWYARELFLIGSAECLRIFESLKHAPIDSRARQKVRAFVRRLDDSIARFEGKVRRSEATYAVIESSAFPSAIFGHISSSLPTHFSACKAGTKVEFGLGFCMEGAGAVSIRPV